MYKYLFSIMIIFNYLSACAVCYGPIDDPITAGVNNAIVFLICVVGFILLSIIGTSIHFYNRSKKIN